MLIPAANNACGQRVLVRGSVRPLAGASASGYSGPHPASAAGLRPMYDTNGLRCGKNLVKARLGAE